jgi:hypothetical protein
MISRYLIIDNVEHLVKSSEYLSKCSGIDETLVIFTWIKLIKDYMKHDYKMRIGKTQYSWLRSKTSRKL